MAIHTSVLFFSISMLIMVKNPNSLLYTMTSKGLTGSHIFRQLAPKIIIFPIVLGNLLLVAVNLEYINTDFGLVAYTVILILMSIIYMSYIAYIAYGLNASEIEKNK